MENEITFIQVMNAETRDLTKDDKEVLLKTAKHLNRIRKNTNESKTSELRYFKMLTLTMAVIAVIYLLTCLALVAFGVA